MDTLAIVKRIEMRLSEIGMGKAEFYSKSGISSASFSQWRTGTYKPSTKKLENAATALGVSYDYLLNGLYGSNIVSFTDGITVFKGSSRSEIDCKVNALEVGSYRVAFQGPGIVITVDKNSPATDEQINSIIATYANQENVENKPTVSGELVIDMSDVDVAFYGGYKELSEEDQKVIRDMVQLMRERRAAQDRK